MHIQSRRQPAWPLPVSRAADGRPAWRPLLLAAALSWGTAPALAASYVVVDLGGTRHGVDTQVSGLNQHGASVGQAGATAPPHLPHPVKSLPGGRAVDLAVQDGMPGVRGAAVAVNDHGQTTGWIEASFGGQVVAFVEQDGAMALYPSPSGEVPTVRGMNQAGDVVGNVWALEDACFGNCAFLLHAGQWTILPALPRGQLSYAYAINNGGLIVGESFQGSDAPLPLKAVLWRDGLIRVIPGMEQLFATAFGVNDHDDIVGEFRLPGTQVQHAFLWRDGSVIDLDGDPASNSRAWAVNAAGQVVGDRTTATRHGYYVTVDGAMQWLDDLLLPGANGAWTLGDVRGLNDAGQVVGTAKDGRGLWRAVRLDPVAP